MVKFSIIIPTYNRENCIKECINSVLSQTFKDFEIIVIDNFSEDSTFNIIENIKDNRVKAFQIHNKGIIAASRNKGIKESNGEWICFLDSDDLWLPNKLETCLNYIDKYDMIYHNMYIYTDFQNKSYKKILKGRKLNEKEPYIDQLLNGNACINSSLVIRKSVIDNIGYISEDNMLVGVEDFDYELNIMKYTQNICFINKSLGLYYIGPSGYSFSEKQANRMEYVYKKHLAGITNQDIKNEILYRLSYRQARIFQLHRNYTEADKKFKLAIKSHSLYYVLRSLLFLTIIRLKRK